MVKMTKFLRKYIFSTDHKVIGKQFLFTGLGFLMIGGIMAMIMRWQLAYPFKKIPVIGTFLFPAMGGILAPENYNMLVTMHGTIMVFFAITPILIGAFGNYLIPLQIGARDMAFPKLNMISYWLMVPAGLILVFSFFVKGGASQSGWTAYPPLASLSTPAAGQIMWILSLALFGFSSILGAVNYITTILMLRAPGMTLFRMPLTLWGLLYTAILNAVFVPVVAVTLILLLLDRVLGTTFYSAGPLSSAEGGQVLLYQHLFWAFGHPEVYILILPGWGIVSDMLSIFSRKPAFGYKATVISMGIISIISGVVWAHHMYPSGMTGRLGRIFMYSTFLVSIPSAVFFLNWLGTLWRGSIRFTMPMIFSLGLVFVFALGGLTGIYNASQAIDIYIHDTYFVVGHFHFTLAASVLFAAFAGIYFWFPKMFGRQMNATLGKIHFWITLVCLCYVFFGMFFLGTGGMMRRIADPTVYDFLKHLQPLNIRISWAAFIMGFSQTIYLVNFVWSLFAGKRVSHNPWDAATLEWTISSPPPEHNFETIPVVHHGPFEYSRPDVKDKDWVAQNEIIA
jgi:cytochrome c oxidase subunit 1